jgi:two-component system, NtrC family, response regulator AtoC
MDARRTAPKSDELTHATEGLAAPAPRSGPEDLALCIVGDGSFSTHLLPIGSTVVLGRGSDVDIRIDEIAISRRHARLENGDSLILEDLGSANGTRVDGRRLAPGERVELAAGTTIKLGTVAVVVCRPGAQGASPAAPSGAAVSAAAQPDVVVTSPKMKALYELAERVAGAPISVLLFGETGAGKEILAETIHRCSPRADKPFLRLNCGALSDSLLESELFGHEKGAFTGAVQTKPGLIESADGGTVFLDEIGEMPASLQVKLLRVLEERRITRVGGLKSRPIDVRVIAATHRDLEDEIQRGRFRQDLFFRLNGISLTIPPLRERTEEIEGLARLFLAQFSRRAGRQISPVLSPEALALLKEHDWPGNIRELRNLMERALVLSTGHVITVDHLPVEKMGLRRARSHSMSEPPPDLLSATALTPAGGVEAVVLPQDERASASHDAAGVDERRRIQEALEKCAGNQTQAARLLGISRTTLIVRLDQYGLPRPRRSRNDPSS